MLLMHKKLALHNKLPQIKKAELENKLWQKKNSEYIFNIL